MIATRGKQNRGFTLIEMMVSVSIFAMVMLMATGALLSIIDASRKAQAQQTAYSNLDAAIESMSRGIRVGTAYRCVLLAGDLGQPIIASPQDCPSGASTFAFEAYGGNPALTTDQTVFRLNGTQIERSLTSGSVGSWVPLTSSQIAVDGLLFYVNGSQPSNSQQPMVNFLVRGHVGTNQKTRSDFNIQTTVSQRLLDI